MPDLEVTDTPEYRAGAAWARKTAPRLAERYSGKELNTTELRSFLWREAENLYPSQRDRMENDLRQTAWVAGAFRSLAETMPMSPEGAAAVFEASLEIGSIVGAELGKAEALEALREKPAAWWSEKVGDASPDGIVSALAVDWRRKYSKEKGVSKPINRYEILKDTLGTREMRALENLSNIEIRVDGRYQSYDVDGGDSSFQVMASDVLENGRIVQGTGEIVG